MLRAKNGIVECRKDEDAHEHLVWEFNNNIRNQEGDPAVGFARAFADFVEGALDEEAGHDLLNQGREDCRQHEDAENCVLEALDGGF